MNFLTVVTLATLVALAASGVEERHSNLLHKLKAASGSPIKDDDPALKREAREIVKRGVLNAIKNVAKNVITFSVSALGGVYKIAKTTVDAVTAPGTFEIWVQELIGSISTDTTVSQCEKICGGAMSIVPVISVGLTPVLCPPLCEAAISRLQEAVSQLTESYLAGDQTIFLDADQTPDESFLELQALESEMPDLFSHPIVWDDESDWEWD